MKLLKAIEEKTVRPVGGRAERTVDVHMVAATNGDLEAMVRAGTFREDLFYRLRVAPLDVPPLRERGDDVDLLGAAPSSPSSAQRYRLPRGRSPPRPSDAIARVRLAGQRPRAAQHARSRGAVRRGRTIDPAALALPGADAEAATLAPDVRVGVRVAGRAASSSRHSSAR